MNSIALFACAALRAAPAPAEPLRPAAAVFGPPPSVAEARGVLADRAAAAGQKPPEAGGERRPQAPVPVPLPQPQDPDWAGLERYRADNARVGPPEAAQERVVFFGDSIMEGWVAAVPAFFRHRPFLGRGISGQTTAQLLVRFDQDVIALRPRAVVILAGTNDIAGNTGPYDQEQTFANLRSMVERALAQKIRPALASLLPARDYPWSPGRKPAPKIAALNALLRDYAQKKGIVYLDWHSAMVGAEGGLRPDLSDDGVHPNRAGYEVMGPLAERALQRLLQSK